MNEMTFGQLLRLSVCAVIGIAAGSAVFAQQIILHSGRKDLFFAAIAAGCLMYRYLYRGIRSAAFRYAVFEEMEMSSGIIRKMICLLFPILLHCILVLTSKNCIQVRLLQTAVLPMSAGILFVSKAEIYHRIKIDKERKNE